MYFCICMDISKFQAILFLDKITLGKYKDELSNGSKEYDAMTLWVDDVLQKMGKVVLVR